MCSVCICPSNTCQQHNQICQLVLEGVEVDRHEYVCHQDENSVAERRSRVRTGLGGEG
jgi:hypothetical protein